jgi:hypothetical protein
MELINTNKIIESKTNIHVSPRIIIEIAIKKFKTDNPNMIKSELLHASESCIGYIIKETGDIFVNLKYINTYHKENFLSRVISNLSHEVIHDILRINESEHISTKFDNIAENIRTDGFLGGI